MDGWNAFFWLATPRVSFTALIPCTSKPARAALAHFKCFYLHPMDLFISGDHHLRNAFARLNRLGGIGKIDDDALDFAPIIAVYRPGSVEQGDATLGSQSASRADLSFISKGELDEKTSGNECALQRLQRDGNFEISAEVHACTARGLVTRQGVGRVIDNFDSQSVFFAQK